MNNLYNILFYDYIITFAIKRIARGQIPDHLTYRHNL